MAWYEYVLILWGAIWIVCFCVGAWLLLSKPKKNQFYE